MDIYDLIILGGGCAGLTAGIYAGRAGLRTLILENGMPGGQAVTAGTIENYPGLPRITGTELVARMQQQAGQAGAHLHCCDVKKISLLHREKRIETGGEVFTAHGVILATGAAPKTLDIPGETEFRGKGISYCATCDGFFYRGRELFVVGGGNSAAQEALTLTEFGRSVTLLVRGEQLGCDRALAARLGEHPKIRILYSTVLLRVSGQDRLEIAVIQNVKTGETTRVDGSPGIFVCIGHAPATGLFREQVALDEKGYILTDEKMHTNIPGVYAAGDVRKKTCRQLVTAAGDGAAAAMQAQQELGH